MQSPEEQIDGIFGIPALPDILSRDNLKFDMSGGFVPNSGEPRVFVKLVYVACIEEAVCNESCILKNPQLPSNIVLPTLISSDVTTEYMFADVCFDNTNVPL
jgi:hypothetical protein